MATRNRTPLYRKYRDALRNVRVTSPSSHHGGASSSGSGGGPVIELVNASLLHSNRSYTPLSTEDPSNSRFALVTDYLYVLARTLILVCASNFYSKC